MSLEAALPRPMRFSIGRVLGDSIGIFARNILWLIALACAARAVVLLASSYDDAAPTWLDQMLGHLASVLASALGDVAIPLCVMQILTGRRASVRHMTAGFRYLVPVTIVTLIVALPWAVAIVVDAVWETGSDTAILLRWLVFEAIGMVLFVRWAVATQANVIEGQGAFAGLARSASLTKGRRWAVFGVTLIPLIVVYALHAGAAILPYILSPEPDVSRSSTLEQSADYLISALSSAYFSVQTTVLHYYLRREKEGADSSELAPIFD